jgi:hypothetical protein
MKKDKIIEICQDPLETETRKKLQKKYIAEKAFINFYKNFEEEAAFPDLYGKCLEVSNSQFEDIYEIVLKISNVLSIKPPRCFIQDNYNYIVDSEGLDNPWLEISAKAYNDFEKNELAFLLAKEIYHIKAGHMYHEIMADKMLNLINALPSIPGINIFSKFGGSFVFELQSFQYRQLSFNWFKKACFSADNFALSYVGDLRSSVNALLLTTLNERSLVERVNINQYINQIAGIEVCLNPMATLEKINEILPYGPYRVLNLLRFYLSDKYKTLRIIFEKV